MKQIKYIVGFLISLATEPEQTWTALAKGNTADSRTDYMQHNYYFPLLGFMSLMVFLFGGLYETADGELFNLQRAMMMMVPPLVGFFVGPYLAVFIIRPLLVNFLHVPNPDSTRLQLFVFYSTSFLVALQAVIAVLPSIRFLQFVAYYLVYITWCGSSIYIRVEQGKRWFFGFASFLIIYMSPDVVMRLLRLFQR